MSKTACIVLVALMLTVAAVIVVCALGDCWRDMKMAELGYEQGTVPESSWPVWVRSKPKP
jgi:hypothetical protein